MSTDPTPAAETRPEYEFTQAQSRTLEQLGGNLIFAGWFVFIVVVVVIGGGALILFLRYRTKGNTSGGAPGA